MSLLTEGFNVYHFTKFEDICNAIRHGRNDTVVHDYTACHKG